MTAASELDVIIIGAGAAGLGCAIALKQCGVERLLVLERNKIAASFLRWPKQMRLITPSFYSNPYLQPDLNAITPDTSPADFLQSEHPTGREYAAYLAACAELHDIAIRTEIEVTNLMPATNGWQVLTNHEAFHAQYVIWAAGEFSQPDDGGVRGAEHCLHNSQIADWRSLPGEVFTLIGGYESGMDAAIHLAWAGKKVRVLSRGEPWQSTDPDPSRSLSPHTRDRLHRALEEAPGSIAFYKNAEIKEVRRLGARWWLLDSRNEGFESPTAPILCTGFASSLGPIRQFFEQQEGNPVFSDEADESTLYPGLFYSGPSLVHRHSLFCFIYKFRSRFGIVARAIAERLGLDWEVPLQAWRERGFMMDDLACCTDCQCAVASAAGSPADAENYTAGSLSAV